MKLKLKNIEVFRTSAIVSVIYFIIGMVIFVPMALLIMALPDSGEYGEAGGGAFAGILMLGMPFFYAIAGFIINMIMIAVFNFFAEKMGGIELTFFEVETPPAPLPPAPETVDPA